MASYPHRAAAPAGRIPRPEPASHDPATAQPPHHFLAGPVGRDRGVLCAAASGPRRSRCRHRRSDRHRRRAGTGAPGAGPGPAAAGAADRLHVAPGASGPGPLDDLERAGDRRDRRHHRGHGRIDAGQRDLVDSAGDPAGHAGRQEAQRTAVARHHAAVCGGLFGAGVLDGHHFDHPVCVGAAGLPGVRHAVGGWATGRLGGCGGRTASPGAARHRPGPVLFRGLCPGHAGVDAGSQPHGLRAHRLRQGPDAHRRGAAAHSAQRGAAHRHAAGPATGLGARRQHRGGGRVQLAGHRRRAVRQPPSWWSWPT
ncbi:hypothetical protein G6F57_016872 [Rhizopus arrhizus]|nr:hypothetical protein G6F57_016872 [Rhizopus arrhizus]